MEDKDALSKLNSESDWLKFLVDLARLAPSSHNTQPWVFRLGSRVIELWGDETRTLPASDANHRQLFISLGCALENLLIAAEHYRLPVEVEICPDSQTHFLAARLTFGHLDQSPRTDGPEDQAGLVGAMTARHANRYEYHDQDVPESFLASLGGLATPALEIHVVREPAARTALTAIVGDATEAAFHDRGFTSELSHWIKPSLKRYRDGMPGYNIDIPWPVSFIAPLVIRYLNVAKPQRRMVEQPLRAAPVFIVLSTKEDDRIAWITAGRILERIWLKATAAGLKIAPLAAGIQIKDFYQKMQQVLGSPFRPQVFFRLGYVDKIPRPAPRRYLEEVLALVEK